MEALHEWAFDPTRVDDLHALLVPGSPRGGSDDRLRGALARVLLREGVTSGAVALSTVGWVDWNEHAVVDIRIRSVLEGTLVLEFNKLAEHMSSQPFNSHEPWDGVWVDAFEKWAEFVGSAEGADMETMRRLTGLHFDEFLAEQSDTTLGDGVLNAEAGFNPEGLTEDEKEIVEILTERFTEDDLAPEPLYSELQDSSPEDYIGLICLWLRETCREFEAADVEGLLKMNELWGEPPLYAQVEPVLTIFSVTTAEDGMVWNGLPEERQREALESVPEWLRALAVVVPGTTEGTLRWLASVATPLVTETLVASPNVSDEIKALAALTS